MSGKKLKSYIEAMASFRGGNQHAAVVEAPRRRKKKSVRSAMALVAGTHKKLTRSRKTVSVSKARRSAGHERTTSGVIPGTTKTRESTMARVKRRRSLAAKRRKRDRYGHFMELANPRKRKKTKKRSSAKRPAKRRVVKRRAAKRNPRRRSVKRTVKRSSPRRTRKRKRPGHHKHTVRRHLRKVRGRKRRIAVKRHRSHETAAEAPRKPARRRRRRARAREEVAMAAVNPRRRRKRRRARAREEVVVYENPRRRAKRRGKKRKGVRGRRRHTVRGHYRKPIRRRKTTRSGKKRVHVKKHMSWEEQQKNARRRKRRRAREAGEMVVANPRKKKRRARRGASRASVPAVIRRRSGGRSRSMPGVIRIQIAGLKSRRSAGKRRSSAKRRSSKRRGSRKTKRRSGSKRRSGTTRKSGWSHYPPGYPRQYRGGYTGAHRQLPPASEFFENPRWDEGEEDMGLSNPLSGGELALAFVTGGIGFALTDLLDRYLATSATPPAGMPNAVAVMTAPGLTRILAQAGFAALPFIGAYFVKQPMGRAALQGLGLGAGIHLVGQLIKSYVMAKALKDNDTGKRLYGDAIAANMLTAAAAGATGATGATGGATGATGGVHGLPFGLGAPLLGIGGVSVPYGVGRPPARAYQDVGPRAGVQGVGQAFAPTGAPYAPTTGVLPLGPHGPTPGGPAPGAPGGGGGGPCDPCAPSTEQQTVDFAARHASVVASAETMQRTLEGAYSAAKDELCGRVGELPTNAVPGAVPGTVGALPTNGGARRKPFAIFPED